MRRLLLCCAALLAATAPAQALTPGRVAFEVTRNGEPFGRHEVVVSQEGGATRVQSRVRLAARVGPVTVFRYEHDCTETWAQDALQTLQCSTLKDGRRTSVQAQRESGALLVQGANGAVRFALSTPPTSWPTRAQLEAGDYIDTETGARRAIRVTPLGRERLTIGGQTIEADRFRIASALVMDAWYDSEGRWVKAAFTARGQRIEYSLASPRAAAPQAA